ncbi:AAA family ATPase [Lysinibacillus fusiformis]|uniref:AAA family ATPase n=1 Tax=Lysinibacillus fusiformis TaxID=28031 RepID=UPI00087FDD40|nr:AAA family ATPase [Lysinibacillus fusiformis]SCX63429.1 Predicted ATP-binding protein involved in virulence [Lysinibacillus fusiformis]SDB46254.1 Predicted ATP-binding protein involved in virulence [Lysinibacillus fusiformis]SFI73042.1 Predicted ATP-binding protein involved in virulence [Lysinibacillus fusiformis]SFT15744.1 Predicted ATP-binding protein involved in virulence [Lysinibacillus fusiformis]
MQLQKINIQGIGGIEELEIDFLPGLNLICGPNGIGKTTILECIVEGFSGSATSSLKRNKNFESGNCDISYFSDFDQYHHYSIQNYEPNELPLHRMVDEHISKKIIYFKSERTFSYTNIDSIKRDTERSNYDYKRVATAGIKFDDFKSWFINRFLFSGHDDMLSIAQKENLKLAIDCFGELDPNVKFKNIKHSTLDIILSSPNGDIYFEYLSSGFKACLYILHGLIKEVEFRFNDHDSIKLKDFDGIVLIDELDLHLHPQWQAKIVELLKKILPNAQIIATTHSPHMIQVAEMNEIIPLSVQDNKVFLRKLPNLKYGFQGWTLEEILEDIMGLKNTHSQTYLNAMEEFEKAISDDELEELRLSYNKIEEMLHPNNPLRKVIKLQMAQMGERIN